MWPANEIVQIFTKIARLHLTHPGAPLGSGTPKCDRGINTIKEMKLKNVLCLNSQKKIFYTQYNTWDHFRVNSSYIQVRQVNVLNHVQIYKVVISGMMPQGGLWKNKKCENNCFHRIMGFSKCFNASEIFISNGVFSFGELLGKKDICLQEAFINRLHLHL